MKRGIFICAVAIILILVLIVFFKPYLGEPTRTGLGNEATTSTSPMEDSIISSDHPYLITARRYEGSGNYDSASIYYQNAVVLFASDSNWLGYAYALNRTAILYLITRRFEDAFPFLQTALDKCESKIGGTKFMSHVYYSLGQYYYYHQENPKKALEMFTKSLEIRQRIANNSQLVATCFNFIGEVHRYLLYDYLTAENYYLKALEISEADPKTDSLDIYYPYFNLATTNRIKGDLDKALYYGEKALSFAQALPYIDFSIHTFNTLGNIRRDRNEHVLALNAYYKSISLCVESQNEIVQGEVYNNMVELFANRQSYDSAVLFAKKALFVFNKYELNEGLGETYFF